MIDNKLQTLSELISRANLATQLGLSYGGNRDLYKAFGYKKELTFVDYYSQYERQELATAIIDRPVNASWRGKVLALETSKAKESPFEKEWIKIEKKIKHSLVMADKLTGIGRYSVLLLGFSDVKTIEDFAKPVQGQKLKLMYATPIYETLALIQEFDTDPLSQRYGKPLKYSITLSTANNGTQSIVVHYSRVLHITENSLDGVYGRPRLQPIFNRLQDVEKLSGGSAEMFWRGAQPGHAADVKDGYDISQATKDNLDAQMDEYIHNLRRIITTEGIDLKAIQQQIADPASQIDIQIMLISAQTGIPKRILTGSERGELSSAQDSGEFATLIDARRETFCEPQILNPLIERLMEYGVLPKIEEFSIEWTSLHEKSEKEKAEVGKVRAEALRSYTTNGDAVMIMPPRAFYEFCLGLNTEQIELLEAMQNEFSTEATGYVPDMQQQEPQE